MFSNMYLTQIPAFYQLHCTINHDTVSVLGHTRSSFVLGNVNDGV